MATKERIAAARANIEKYKLNISSSTGSAEWKKMLLEVLDGITDEDIEEDLDTIGDATIDSKLHCEVCGCDLRDDGTCPEGHKEESENV